MPATVSITDKEFLQEQLSTQRSSASQARTTTALARLLANSNDSALEELYLVEDPHLRLAASKGAILAGDRRGFPHLVKLLESSSSTIRCEAAALLYQHTGKAFGYAGYDSAARRASSIAKWKSWLNQNGTQPISPSTSRLTTSGRVIVGIQLKETSDAKADRRRGREKTTDRSNVLEFTPSGSIRWHM